MSNKPIYHITAKSIVKDVKLDLEFGSLREAACCNSGLKDFEFLGPAKKKQ